MKKAIVWVALLLIAGCNGDDDAASVVQPAPPATASPTATPSPTPTLGPGGQIGFLGVLRADNTQTEPSGLDGEGREIYSRVVGSGFVLVVEAERGSNGAPLGNQTLEHDPADASVRPDLQIQVTRDLGDGTPAVCDNGPEVFGGVPGIDPPSFEASQAVADALNDLGCRFIDGAGGTIGRPAIEACVLFPDGEFRFIDPTAEIQFCGTVTRPLSFPQGDTVVTARVRDADGVLGPARQIVIRVGATSP